MVAHIYNPALGRQRQEDSKFDVRLGVHSEKLSPKKKKKKRKEKKKKEKRQSLPTVKFQLNTDKKEKL
jgi:hypothetical protein